MFGKSVPLVMEDMVMLVGEDWEEVERGRGRRNVERKSFLLWEWEGSKSKEEQLSDSIKVFWFREGGTPVDVRLDFGMGTECGEEEEEEDDDR